MNDFELLLTDDSFTHEDGMNFMNDMNENDISGLFTDDTGRDWDSEEEFHETMEEAEFWASQEQDCY